MTQVSESMPSLAIAVYLIGPDLSFDLGVSFWEEVPLTPSDLSESSS